MISIPAWRPMLLLLLCCQVSRKTGMKRRVHIRGFDRDRNSSSACSVPMATMNSKERWQRRASSLNSVRPPRACLQPSVRGRALHWHAVRRRSDAIQCASTWLHLVERPGQLAVPSSEPSTDDGRRKRRQNILQQGRQKWSANISSAPASKKADQLRRSGGVDDIWKHHHRGPPGVCQTPEPSTTNIFSRLGTNPPQPSGHSCPGAQEGKTGHGAETWKLVCTACEACRRWKFDKGSADRTRVKQSLRFDFLLFGKWSTRTHHSNSSINCISKGFAEGPANRAYSSNIAPRAQFCLRRRQPISHPVWVFPVRQCTSTGRFPQSACVTVGVKLPVSGCVAADHCSCRTALGKAMIQRSRLFPRVPSGLCNRCEFRYHRWRELPSRF